MTDEVTAVETVRVLDCDDLRPGCSGGCARNEPRGGALQYGIIIAEMQLHFMCLFGTLGGLTDLCTSL